MRLIAQLRKSANLVQAAPETAELNPAKPEAFLPPAHSVTENTTRSFERVAGINRSGSE